MFYTEDFERITSVFTEHRQLSQLQGCVIDLLAAREAVTEQLDHLDNAQRNCAEFVGPGEGRIVVIGGVAHHLSNVDGVINIVKHFIKPGEDRWVIVGDCAHHLSNVDGTINIVKYFQKEKLCR